MDMDALRQRINTLAHKAKTQGLTPAEEQERAALRKEYLQQFRAGFQQQLDNTFIVDEQGNKTPLTKYKK